MAPPIKRQNHPEFALKFIISIVISISFNDSYSMQVLLINLMIVIYLYSFFSIVFISLLFLLINQMIIFHFIYNIFIVWIAINLIYSFWFRLKKSRKEMANFKFEPFRRRKFAYHTNLHITLYCHCNSTVAFLMAFIYCRQRNHFINQS